MPTAPAPRPTLPRRFEPRFIEEADQRFNVVKELKKRYEALLTDTAADSEQKRMLCKRAIFINVQLETMETNAAEGGAFDLGVYTSAVNSLSGLLTKLGLDRQMKAAGAADLATYLQGQAS